MYDVVTLGEAMARLSPPHFDRLEQMNSLDVHVGGGELNVAVAAARIGLSAAWISKLPRTPLGSFIRNKAREHGVDTSHIVWADEGRVGLYFVEFGASPRPSAVIYDRANSAVSTLGHWEIDWKTIFKDVKVFHVSGITPALSKSCAETVKEALKAAKAAGCKVTYDLNYRAKLWSERDAQICQEPLMQYVDVLITTEEDTKRVFQISAGADESFKEVSAEAYKQVAVKLQERFKFPTVAITLRDNISVWKNNWTAIAYSEGQFFEDVKYEVEIVDRVGGGDSFSAGFIYGYLQNDIALGVRFGNALAALKHSIPGDFNFSTKEEVEKLIEGGGSVRIVR